MSVTHATIDERLLRLVARCVVKIDADGRLLERVRAAVQRQPDARIRAEWEVLLAQSWPALRERLLEQSERGESLRQNAPLGGVLTPAERMVIFRAS